MRAFLGHARMGAWALLVASFGCAGLGGQEVRERLDRYGRRGEHFGARRMQDDEGSRAEREGRAFGPRNFDGPIEVICKQGFLFVNGEYLAPPYALKLAAGELTVNGKKIECEPPNRGFGRGYGPPGPYGSPYGPQSPYGSGGGSGSPASSGSGGSRSGEAALWRFSLNELQGQLGSGDLAVFCFAGQPYTVFDASATYDLLKAITAENGRALREVSVRERLPAQFDKAVWDEWWETFEPGGELLTRSAVLINRFEQSQRQADADMRASRLINQLSYPLAVGGMVLSVLAIGHLLGGRPHARQRVLGVDESPEMIHSLNWSLLFVAAFTLLDLTWTILAANAGQMQELNPIGSHLIENPRHLAGFKLGITLPSLALIWLLRKYKRAQVAAWWICLVLTFVTLRWLTMSQLFVTV